MGNSSNIATTSVRHWTQDTPCDPVKFIMEDINIKDYPSLFSLQGKVAVVTGGSRGLGLTAASA